MNISLLLKRPSDKFLYSLSYVDFYTEHESDVRIMFWTD
jgi:hypothetical protein